MPQRIEVIRGLGIGGAEALLVQRYAHIERLGQQRRGQTVVINSAPKESFYKASLEATSVRVIETPSNLLVGGVRTVSRVRELADGSPVIVHSPGPAFFLKVARALRLLRTPIVQVNHSSESRRLYAAAGRMSDRFAIGSIAVGSDVAASAISRRFKRTLIVHGGIDTQSMATLLEVNPNLRKGLRASLGIAENDLVFCAVGTLSPRKGQIDIVRAMSRLTHAAHLVIVGAGPMHAALEAQIAQDGLMERVHLVGRYTPGWHWMAASDALCHASSLEGLPVVLMEAQALGIPVIATAFAGAKEAAERNDSEIVIVPVGDVDAIAKAMDRVKPLDSPVRSMERSLRRTYWSAERYVADFEAAVRVLTVGEADSL